MLNEIEIRAQASRYANAVAEITSADHGPMRTIHRRGKRKPIGRYPSHKNGRALTWESVHERHLMWLSEADPEIVSYIEQPHRVRMEIPDTKTRDLVYFPDLLREHADGRHEIIEVKKSWDEIRDDPMYEAKLELAAKIYQAKGYTFNILTADDIEIEPYFSNAQTIQRYRFTRVDSLDKIRFHEALDAANGELSLGDAIIAVSSKKDRFDPLAYAIVCALIVRREAFVNLRKTLDHNASIRKTLTSF
jgi:hypothetical protein